MKMWQRDAFERIFLRKFGEEKTLASLLKELISIKMEKTYKVNDFSEHLTTLLNKIPIDSHPTYPLTVDFYTLSLHLFISMFLKRFKKNTLALKFEEAIKDENEILSLAGINHKEKTKTNENKCINLNNFIEKESKLSN